MRHQQRMWPSCAQTQGLQLQLCMLMTAAQNSSHANTSMVCRAWHGIAALRQCWPAPWPTISVD